MTNTTNQGDAIRGGLRNLRGGRTVTNNASTSLYLGIENFTRNLDGIIQKSLQSEELVFLARVQYQGLPNVANDTITQEIHRALLERFNKQNLNKIACRITNNELLFAVTGLRRRTDVEQMLTETYEFFKKPIISDGMPYYLLPHIGAAIADKENNTADLLIKATYSAFSETTLSRPMTLFHPYQKVKQKRQEEASLALHSAVSNKKIDMVFQPSFSFKNSSLEAFEVLARWENNGSVVPAAGFIGQATEMGFVSEVNQQVIQKAVTQTAAWQKNGATHAPLLWFNASSQELLHPNFIGTIESALSEIPSLSVGLQITDLPTEQAAEISPILQMFAGKEIRLGIGNFGTGSLDLQQLSNLPFDSIFLEPSLIGHIANNKKMAQAVKQLIQIGHIFNLKVTAVGVESKAQAELLQSFGCDYGQGFFFKEPLDKVSAAELVKNFRS